MAELNKIVSATSFDFQGKNLIPYGGLFPVATMLEKLGFQKLINENLTVRRIPRVMTIYQFVLGMVLAIYVGFARLNHLRFCGPGPDADRDPEGEQAAGAKRILAVSGLAESERSRATVAAAAHPAPLIKPDGPVSGVRLPDGRHRRLTYERHIGSREA